MRLLNKPRSVTLFELLIAIALLSFVLLAFSSMHIFSNAHVITSDRRAKLQNEVSKALEHMTKNVQMGAGYPGRLALSASVNGFTVITNPGIFPAYWVPTPNDPNDDVAISYALNANTLSCTIGTEIEFLSRHIMPGVVYGPMPDSPGSGFYILFSNNYSMVEIGLVARFDPARDIAIDNPQVAMKTRMYARASAAN